MRNKYSVLFLALSLVVLVAGCGRGKKAEEVSKGEVDTGAPKVEKQNFVRKTPSTAPITEERTLFGFERGDNGFEIPSWVEGRSDNAAISVRLSKSFASEGNQSLCLTTDFPGKIWSSSMIELEQYLDFSPYRQIMVDVYAPEKMPLGLKAKIVLTVGEKWKWTEMARSVPLNPGEWITISASLEPGTMDWKRTEVTDEFRADIRKLVVRVESNKRPIYSGPIYFDNVRVGR